MIGRPAAPTLIFDFYHPVYGGAALGECLVLPETFGPERLFLEGPHLQGVISGFVQLEKRMSCLDQVVLCGHREGQVAVPSYSKV